MTQTLRRKATRTVDGSVTPERWLERTHALADGALANGADMVSLRRVAEHLTLPYADLVKLLLSEKRVDLEPVPPVLKLRSRVVA